MNKLCCIAQLNITNGIHDLAKQSICVRIRTSPSLELAVLASWCEAASMCATSYRQFQRGCHASICASSFRSFLRRCHASICASSYMSLNRGCQCFFKEYEAH